MGGERAATVRRRVTGQTCWKCSRILDPDPLGHTGERDYDRWLTREATSYIGAGHGQPPTDLLRPFPADEMHAHEAHVDVGNVRNNHSALLNSA